MKKTEVPRGTWENSSFLASRRQNEHNEVPQSAASAAEKEPDTILDRAGRVRRKLHRAIQRGDRDLAVRLCAREYLPVLEEIQYIYLEHDLMSMRHALQSRLKRGWSMDASPSRDRTFQKLLSRYEVIEDCLAGDVMTATFDRLDRVSA